MEKLIRIGIDTSKSVFQLHGVDESEHTRLCKKLRRQQVLPFFAQLAPTRIGIEACGASHFWARELVALGHDVVLLPPQYVKPYVKRGKNDAADAEAICEAMSRPSMRFVPIKTAEQQAALMLAGVREQLVRRRTQIANMIRGNAAEFGQTAAKGLAHIEALVAEIERDDKLPALAKEMFCVLGQEYAQIKARLCQIEAKLMAWHRASELSQRLAKIPGVGPIGASMLVMKVTNPRAFHSARHFAAWIGLTPKDHSTAGKTRLGGITHAGDETLRSMLVVGASSVVQQIRLKRGKPSPWLTDLLGRKPYKLVAVALANKIARIVWKMMVTGEAYSPARQPDIATASA